MNVVDIESAAASLLWLIAELESGATHEFVITRAGRPVARLVPNNPQRIGIARGVFEVGDSISSEDSEIEKLFKTGAPK
jgi:antitoxin (DNA-binding transcriptional repressor) of toxin-antitoxin stability system